MNVLLEQYRQKALREGMEKGMEKGSLANKKAMKLMGLLAVELKISKKLLWTRNICRTCFWNLIYKTIHILYISKPPECLENDSVHSGSFLYIKLIYYFCQKATY